MLSSTSNSKPPTRFDTPIAGWIMAIVMVLLTAELVTRFGFDRISRIQSRTRLERTSLSQYKIRTEKPSLLMVGNSLLLEGVDFPVFQEAVSPRVQSLRYIVEQTAYYDWYYGLKNLFSEGVHPNYVLIGFAAPHLNAPSIRGDYSAHYLLDRSGILDYARLVNLDWTSTSNLLFAHYSQFYGIRSELRAFLINKLLPSYSADLHELTMQRAVEDTDEHVAEVAQHRLAALDKLCRENGAKLIFLITPTGQPGENGIALAGRKAGVTVLMPVPRANLKPENFADGFHLSASGRAIFTRALLAELENRLPEAPSNKP